MIKLAFISDLHEQKAEAVMKIIKQIDPEIILLGGDILHDPKCYENGINFLKATASLCPTLCCLGNHEQLFKEKILTLVARTGVIPLDNAALQYKDINIGALSSPLKKATNIIKKQNLDNDTSGKKPDIAWLNEYEKIKGYKILLCHQPEYYDKYIREHNIDLVLSGHAHGGQWRIGNQGVYAPGQGFFPKYTAGIYESRLIVSRGIGNAHLIPRINNKPEIILIKIIPSK